MRTEKLFSKDGCYSHVIESNALFHREAIIYGTRVIHAFLENGDAAKTIKVLDLACGAEPVSITAMLNNFPDRNFSYTGIDINPDQVSFAKQYFKFPENIRDVTLFEGNAWDPRLSALEGHYDIVFMGLNLHHGTPEEVYYLAKQLAVIISDKGVYINHDVYRPDDQSYQRRPDHHPDNAKESFLLLEPGLVESIRLPQVTHNELGSDAPIAAWRQTYNDLLRQTLIDQGAGSECAHATYQHAHMRDYPISLSDFAHIFKQADKDFSIKILRYGDGHPLMDYIAMPVVSKASQLLEGLC